MKKTISTLVVVMLFLTIITPSVLTGDETFEPFDPIVWDNGNPIWGDPYAIMAQNATDYPFIAYPADDFILDNDTEITGVHWWMFYPATFEDPADFSIYFYADDGSGLQPTGAGMGDPTPTALVRYTFNLLGTPDDVYYAYEATLDPPFQAIGGVKYWIQINADELYNEGDIYYLARRYNLPATLTPAVLGSPALGYPFWTTIWSVQGDPPDTDDLAFYLMGIEPEEEPLWTNHKMHFPQLPNPIGWDVDFGDWFLGDDWMCNGTGTVDDIHFWVSWYGDNVEYIPFIYASIWSNNDTEPSHPEELLWEYMFTDAQFNVTEEPPGDQGFYTPEGSFEEHNHMWYFRIDIENISDPFIQYNGTIYWLVIQMPYYGFPNLVGWKTSLDWWNDNAVWGIPGNWTPLSDPMTMEPLHFAFVITGETYEEPEWNFTEHKMHYPQLPDPNGWDVDFWYLLLGDDWQCSASGWVEDIHFWISWYEDIDEIIPWINVSIWSNYPGPPYSTPDEMLWQQIFYDFNVTGPWIGEQGYYAPDEEYWEEDNHIFYWQIDIENISNPFYQINETIYWLVINMPTFEGPMQGTYIGWKTTTDNWNDNAVWTYGEGPFAEWYNLSDPITNESLDFSFVITGEAQPEWEEHKMHYPQLPDPNGWDVLADEPAMVLADDWQCSESGYITDIYFWGSWMGEMTGDIFHFNIFIFSDTPANETHYSMPNETLWWENFELFNVTLEGTNLQGWYDPLEGYILDDHLSYFRYHISNITNPFYQEEGTIYWLGICPYVLGDEYPLPPLWGWKTSLNHWNDDACFAPFPDPPYFEWYNLTDPITHETLDMAFVLEAGFPVWDINQDGIINYLDVSALVSHYGESGPPGWIPEDINDDGIINYLDVSALVSHYGESY